MPQGLVATAAGYAEHDLVWQSRSGPPQVPWLEPDVVDHLATLADNGTTAVIVCPIGFVADHIEVVWDLDHELRLKAEELGVALGRAGTPNADPRFARLAVDLIDELRDGRDAVRVSGAEPVLGCLASNNGEACARHTAWRTAILKSVRHAECRIALTAAIRAERTTAVNGRKSVGGDLTFRRRLRPAGSGAAVMRVPSDPAEPGADRDDRVDVRRVLQHPQCPRRRMIGNLVLPCGFQQLLDEAARFFDAAGCRSESHGGQCISGRPHCRPQRVFGIAELVVVEHRGAGQRVHHPCQCRQFRYDGLVVDVFESSRSM